MDQIKVFLVQALLFVACQSAHHSLGNTPTYIAVVQEKMPGNIMADDEPGAHQRHFTRWVYVLIDNSKTLQIDSVVYGNELINFETEKMENRKQLQVGNMMSSNKPVILAATTGKTWWKIKLEEGNNVFDHSPELQNPFIIYTRDGGKQTNWQIEKESEIAPQERY